MKLFVWANPYSAMYGSTLLFAVAETVEQAREIAKSGLYCTFGTPDYADGNNEWLGEIKLGEPTRISELPCAEWHEWSE